MFGPKTGPAYYFNNDPLPRGRPKSAAAMPNRMRYGAAQPPFAKPASFEKEYADFQSDARNRYSVGKSPSERMAAARAARSMPPHLEMADSSIPVPVKTRIAFAAFDRNHSGFLDFRELKNALRHYGFDVTTREAARVLAAYDDHPNGKLDLDEFARLVKDLNLGLIRANAAPSYDYEKVPARVRRAFATFDTNRSGYLDYRELRNALRAYGLDVTVQGSARILAAYDYDPDGKMDLIEFSRLVSDLDHGQIKSTRETVPERARKAFEKFDANKDGQLDVRELRHALKQYGMDVTRGQAYKVLQAYDDHPNKRLDIIEFANLVQDLELGLIRSSTPKEGYPRRPGTAGAMRRPGTPAGAFRPGYRRPGFRPGSPPPDVPLGSRGLAAFSSDRRRPHFDDEDDEDMELYYDGLRVDDDESTTIDDDDSVIGGGFNGGYAIRNSKHVIKANAHLRAQLAREKMTRKAAEKEAKVARELAYDARKRLDRERGLRAERDLDDALEMKRKGIGMSYDGYGKEGLEMDPLWAGGGTMSSKAVKELMRGRPSTPGEGSLMPLDSAAPEKTRGHVMLLRDLNQLEAQLYSVLEGRSKSDGDASRKEVLTRCFKSCTRHGDRFVNSSEFAMALGKLGCLGASRFAGYRENQVPHHVITRPAQSSYDVNHELVNALFLRYADPSGADNEKLVDIEAFYGRMKRSLQPPPKLSKEKTGVEMMADKLEQDVLNHPNGGNFQDYRHPYGKYPQKDTIGLERPPSAASRDGLMQRRRV